ncbi:DUF1631 domain-containing protein [Marinobacter alexandrii]|uniref:DUF1631 family protein n=1 Tax=Marinobacter alexandrii TaxID=2570351 RepID=UPI001FFF9349|nr:DUF1631 family protein [Marinobacter alexandrii]MCK2147684.1 DUF1631 domain-containing protein [Marinobacter alexandrii]
MSQNRQKPQGSASRQAVSGQIGDVLSGIRVPDLPYPAGKLAPEAVSDWRPLLSSCWAEQRDERVTHVIRSVHLDWSSMQINAAYVADRIMDVFLKTSGLHPELACRIARLRFYLAWRMNLEGANAFCDALTDWLDSLQEWRGWSDSGGRSSRVLLDQLDALVIAVSSSFKSGEATPVEEFCRQWQQDAQKRNAQTGKLRKRLLETEQGAARQRRADQTARALIGRALQGRMLPPAITEFILDYWYRLLKQAIWTSGVEGEGCRHGSKLLEWLVWVGDPSLSDKDRDRLYTVGEQIGDRLMDVWNGTFGQALEARALAGIENVMVSRLRGETPELAEALPKLKSFAWDSSWLGFSGVQPGRAEGLEGGWFVEGEGRREQRRFFFALLEDTAEILWTNGAGVKLGLQPWAEFETARTQSDLRPLPTLTPFGQVLTDTVTVLANVCAKQRKQREQAARDARERAEALRREREAAEQVRLVQEAARASELQRQRESVEQQRLEDQRAEQERLDRKQTLLAQAQADGIKLGGWIVVNPDDADNDPIRLKLAVRINASRKLVFVDRLGLNRREFIEDQLVEGIVSGKIRVLGSSAEFDDTLSRVVGRIRVGRN